MLGQKLVENEYISDDFDLKGQQFYFPMTYLLNNNVSKGDKVLVLTAVEKGNDINHISLDNYEKYKAEVNKVVETKGVTAEFQEIMTDDEFTVFTGKGFFKEIVKFLQDDDSLYADFTFGIKIFTISMFIALNYVVSANKNVNIKHIIYSWKYSSAVTPEKAKQSKIYDVTSLFFINSIAAQLNEGDRKSIDKMLGL